MMRKTKTAISTLPNFDNASITLINAMSFLENTWRTCRVERLPLCFMRWYEWVSTETRKIVKDEERIVHFLDEREYVRQYWDWWEHEKLQECNDCDLNSICAGVYEYNKYYNYIKVYKQKLSVDEKKKIIDKIKKE